MSATAAAPGWRWAPAWVVAFVALWPAPGVAEAVLALGAIAAVLHLLLSRFRGSAALLTGPAWALTSVLFFAYWLPEAISAIDAADRARALREALVDLRYLPFLWLVASAVTGAEGRRRTFGGLAVIVAAWTLDALLQAATGSSLLFAAIDGLKQAISGHGMCTAAEVAALDRLSGVLGPCNLKLGIVLASLSPFALDAAGRRYGRIGWALAAVLVGLAVLLAGSRAAWLSYCLVLAWTGWRLLGIKRLLAVFALGIALLLASALVSPPWISKVRPRYFVLITLHSKCQPGKPSPHGEGQCIRWSFSAFFHSAKSSGLRFSSWPSVPRVLAIWSSIFRPLSSP